jgi:hypothetical protein
MTGFKRSQSKGSTMKYLIVAAMLGGGFPAHAADSAFVLKPEWAGPCQKSAVVDVNLGNSPESFVKAAYCQCNGKLPDAATVADIASRLRQDASLRRVDVVNRFIKESGHPAKLRYSNPWQNNPELAPPLGAKKTKRDVGAITMFFFNCPGGVNCGMDWANTHVLGMEGADPSLAWGNQAAGVYNAANPGFWRHELRDAKAAGLQFILPNTYGPDIQEGKIKTLALALAAETDPVKVGLFDDTWPWGEKWFGPYWQQKPDLSKSSSAAMLLYEAKWKPFFSQVPRKYWYTVDGKPMIYFYSADKLQPRNQAAAVFRLMKAYFKRDFGVEPFLVADRAYFDDPNMPQVADGRFIWDPLKFSDGYVGMSRAQVKGRVLCHAMVKWDPIGRDRPGTLASPADNLLKGPELLQKVLKDSADADFLVLATWNDLGEGTGVNRNYDYYYMGRWLAPDTFMRLIRDSQFP